ncbi:hypothetical protein IAR55_004900 [Kwoniella newhampshirensis]|uniref:Major facilitator superfamily (MFS) profile domain-containing protein n=1 Tax=Kwoniella newhampshirensis TaxID=1651941 RepID=A0AAW0YIF8_9TREE
MDRQDRKHSIAKSLNNTFDIDIEAVADIDNDNDNDNDNEVIRSPTDRSPSPTLLNVSSSRTPSVSRRFLNQLSRSIDTTSKATHAIAIYSCFLTGLTAAPSFAACYVWCGFQTGNAAQLGLAIARTWTPGADDGFQIFDRQALVSLLSFLCGATLGQIGNKVGGRRRCWLVGATMGMMTFMLGAALAAHFSGENGIATGRGDPSWVTPTGMLALALSSVTMGLQGAVGCRLGSPLGCTVPLTSTWVDIFNDPFLFALKHVRTRDVRLMGAFSLIFGACVSRCLMILMGTPGTMGVIVGFRAIQGVWWIFAPDEPRKEDQFGGEGRRGSEMSQVTCVEQKR